MKLLDCIVLLSLVLSAAPAMSGDSCQRNQAAVDIAWTLDAFCSRIVASGEPIGVELQAVTEPRDIIEFFGLHLLMSGDLTPSDADRDERLSRAAYASATRTVVTIPQGSNCTWTPISSLRDAASNGLVLRASPVVENPYAESVLNKGVFLEFSSGGQAVTLFWVAQTPSTLHPHQVTIIELGFNDTEPRDVR